MKKRIISLASAAVFALSGISGSISAAYAAESAYPSVAEADTLSEYSALWSWSNCADHIEMMGYYGNSADVVIPDTIEGLPVTSVSAGCFAEKADIVRSLYIPSTVTEISGVTGGLPNLEKVETDEGNTSFICQNGGVFTADGKVLLRCLTSVEGEFSIPDTVERIEENAFLNCKKLKSINVGENNEYFTGRDGVLFDKYMESLLKFPIGSVNVSYTVPDGVMEIAPHAFDDADSLEKLEISARAEIIGDYAFYGCDKLNNVVIPDNVLDIGESAFRNCTGLSDITFSTETIFVGEWAVSGTPWYEAQPDGVVYTGAVLYKLKGRLPENSEIVVREGTVSINRCAFDSGLDGPTAGDPDLISVTLPDSVRYIGEKAFFDCESLKKINLPDSIEKIGEMAFASCLALEEVHIPASLDVIEAGTFLSCSSLKKLTVPKNISVIRDGALGDCRSLESVVFENAYCIAYEPLEYYSLSSGYVAFSGTIYGYEDSYAQYYAESKGYSFVSLGKLPKEEAISFEYEKNDTWKWLNCKEYVLVSAYYGDCEVIELPDKLNGLPVRGVDGCLEVSEPDRVRTVKIPAGIEDIGEMFDGLRNISEIEVDKDNKSLAVENGVLYTADRKSLIKCIPDKVRGGFSIPGTVTYVHKNAFNDCSGLTVLNVPASVQSMNCSFTRCDSLEAVNVSKVNKSFSSINGVVFNNGATLLCKYPPKHPGKSYKLPESVSSIDAGAFENCDALESIVFTNNVTGIHDRAFAECDKLDNVELPERLIYISDHAFENCKSLKSIKVPDEVTSFGADVLKGTAWLEAQDDGPVYCGTLFYGIKGEPEKLTEITVKEGTKCIAAKAFSFEKQDKNGGTVYENAYLRSVILPKGLKYLCSGAFMGCSALTYVELPDDVLKVDGQTFSGCKSLKDIVVSKTDTIIRNNEYSGCDSLKNVIVPENINYIDCKAFVNCASLESVTVLNPECSFYDSSDTICNKIIYPGEHEDKETVVYNGTIYGYDGSTAETFAKGAGYKFVSLGKAPSDYELGDINVNGIVDAVDASMVLAYYAKISTNSDGGFNAGQQVAADVNRDGIIDAVDASKILSYYAYASTAKGKLQNISEFLSGIRVFAGFDAGGTIRNVVGASDGQVVVGCEDKSGNTCYVFDTLNDKILRSINLSDRDEMLIGMFAGGTVVTWKKTYADEKNKLKMYPANGGEPYEVDTGSAGYTEWWFDSETDNIYWVSYTDDSIMKINEKGEKSRHLSLSGFINAYFYLHEKGVFVGGKTSDKTEIGVEYGLYSVVTGELIAPMCEENSDVFLTKDSCVSPYSVGNDRDYYIKASDTSGNSPDKYYKLTLAEPGMLQFISSSKSSYLLTKTGAGNRLFFTDAVNGKTVYGDVKELNTAYVNEDCCYVTDGKWIIGMNEMYSVTKSNSLVMVDPGRLNYSVKLKNADGKVFEKTGPVEVGEKFKEIRAEADKIEEEFGIRILVGNEVKNAEAGSEYSFGSTEAYTDESSLQYEKDSLKNLRETLSLYPEGFFSRFNKENGQIGLRISLVRELIGKDGSKFKAGGVAFASFGWYEIAILSRQTSENCTTLHHEIWHSVERMISEKYGSIDEEEWKKLNPADFDYSADFEEYAENDEKGMNVHTFYNAIEKSEPQYDLPYFVSDYSMVTAYEDRATLIELLFLWDYDTANRIMYRYSEEYIKKYPHLKAKLEFLENWSKKEFGYVYWQKMLENMEKTR
ncbi:MAG: leucine-rich repeat protein [Ruminococcus sp.]|uniref:leucine-rich repeat protein n=1 Tax=Ruminococcus sp. TaxID=41978 RepID=UPI0025EAF3F7|nr:leucine-rich repeat protein [Ruminococcus sp.]MBR5683130.1 leucine-rich repeat protein [Ruminococcus sp.]